MRKYLNTLFVMTEGSYLKKEGETVVVKVGDETKIQLPIHNIGSIVCFGYVSCSPYLMSFCNDNKVSITFLSQTGRFLARVHGSTHGNVLLRRQQYRYADDVSFSSDLAKSFIAGKIANSRVVLQRAIRDHSGKVDGDKIESVVSRLGEYLKMLEWENALDKIRGIEGNAASNYFEVFDNLIVAQKESFLFEGRNRRPPKDNMNALLSFLYTLLRLDVQSALESVGLDPYVGFLHTDRPGRASLALDVMEEFRPILADRIALSLVNLKQVQAKDFRTTESGAVIMTEKARKKVIIAYQERKKEKILHPFIGERIEIGLLPHIQAMLLARYIRGDIDGYPPFIWR